MDRILLGGMLLVPGYVPGSARVFEDLKGWNSGSPIRGALTDRPTSDGAFGITRAYRSSRVMTLTGHLLADSEIELVGLMRELAAIQPGGAPFVLSVDDAAGTLTSEVTVNGTPLVEQLDETSAEFEIPLLAPDAVKYGPTVATAINLPSSGGGFVYPAYEPLGYANYGPLGNLGRAVISNVGTADVWPVFEFADEHVVSVDAASGGVLVDGQSDGGSSLLRAEWFPIPAGGSVTVQFSNSGGVLEAKCIETGQAIQVARSVGPVPVLTVFSASGWW